MIQRIFPLAVVGVALFAQPSYAQNASGIAAGTTFANSIVSTSPSQIVNSSAVSSTAWNSTATPVAVPSNLGAFSNPATDNSTYTSAASLGLTGIGLKTQSNCVSNVPGTNSLMDQQCAAVNFMSNNCLPQNTTEKAVVGSVPVVSAGSSNCNGTYGQGATQFNYGNQVTPSDPLFATINNSQSTAATTLAGTAACTQQTVVTTPAQYATETCVTSSSTTQMGCSQSLNTTVITNDLPATVTDSCSNGVLVGNYCQSSSTGAAAPMYVCPIGYTLNGITCSEIISNPGTPNYSCPVGSTLSGTNCLSQNNVSTPASISSYSCPVGYALSGTTCSVTLTQSAAIASYSCPTGQSLSGTTCITTSTTTTTAASTYSCPSGTLSGTSCTATSSSAATANYSCPAGDTSTGSGSGMSCQLAIAAASKPPCTTFTGWQWDFGGPAPVKMQFCTAASLKCSGYLTTDASGNINYVCEPPTGCPAGTTFHWNFSPYTREYNIPACVSTSNVYSCPTGGTLSGSTCTSTSSATVSSFSCPSGGTLASNNCITTTTTSATISYSCPVGLTLAGSNCTEIITTTSPATPNYSCPTGDTLSGTTCSGTVTSPATNNYSCPNGSTLNGINCLSQNNVSTPAGISSYSCSNGYSLSGSTCSATTTTSATISSYTCPNGSTLSGTSCVTLTSIPATVNYSCSDGSAPINGVCILRSVQTSWADTCVPYETSAGSVLPIP